MRRPLKTSGPTPRSSFVATWTRSQVYLIQATTFDDACERALADRHLYTPHTVEKLTVRQLQPRDLREALNRRAPTKETP
jgi:hypothetical protein